MKIVIFATAVTVAAVANQSFAVGFEFPKDKRGGNYIQKTYKNGSLPILLQNTEEHSVKVRFELEDNNGNDVADDQWRSNLSKKKDDDSLILPPDMSRAKRVWIQIKTPGKYYLCLNTEKMGEDEEEEQTAIKTVTCRALIARRETK